MKDLGGSGVRFLFVCVCVCVCVCVGAVCIGVYALKNKQTNKKKIYIICFKTTLLIVI